MRILALLLVFIPGFVSAQFISHGPVTGGVGPDSARIYVRTAQARSFDLQYDTDPAFGSPQSISDSTRVWRDKSNIVTLHGLQPDTRYFFRFRFNGNTFDTRKGSFKTAPVPGTAGNYTFVTGSCQETANMKVFNVMPMHQPDMLIHTGDFTYPSYQQSSNYPAVFSEVELAYRRRYQEVNMDTMLFNMPIAYINDDDDGFAPSHDGWYSWGYDTIGGVFHNQVNLEPVTAQERTNCTEGYLRFFPGFPPVDTTGGGLYHKFTYGNAEFFFLDTRNLANAPVASFQYDSAANHWTFAPPPGLSIVGADQMQWLLDGLQNSTATWKFIVGGVPFNPGYRRLIDIGMLLQDLVTTIAGENGSGMRLAVSFSGYWAGYPQDVSTLLGHIHQHNIANTIFISGDTHHNVMDDGTNARMPELNASGLSVTTTELAYQLDQAAQLLGQPSLRDSLWNKGGNGLGNMDFSNGFGKIEVFGEDSVRLCVINEDNETLSCFIIQGGNIAGTQPLRDPALTSATGIVSVSPNPATSEIQVILDATVDPMAIEQVYMTDVNGRIIKTFPTSAFSSNGMASLQTDDLAAGMYFIFVDTQKVRFGKPFVIEN